MLLTGKLHELAQAMTSRTSLAYIATYSTKRTLTTETWEPTWIGILHGPFTSTTPICSPH
jgi:hypothetical protein